jgi:hypothetical protein
VPEPIASWNQKRDVWEVPGVADLFSEHLDVYSETFPASGMTVNGVAYELPTWEHHTDGSASSSLLRTVMADEAGGGPLSPAMASARGQTLRLTGQMIDLVNPSQPNAYSDRGGTQHPEKKKSGGHQVNLDDVAEHILLPTPRATDGTKGGPNQRGSSGDLMLPSAVTQIGAPSVPLSGAGNKLWEDVPLPLPNQQDATETTD